MSIPQLQQRSSCTRVLVVSVQDENLIIDATATGFKSYFAHPKRCDIQLFLFLFFLSHFGVCGTWLLL